MTNPVPMAEIWRGQQMVVVQKPSVVGWSKAHGNRLFVQLVLGFRLTTHVLTVLLQSPRVAQLWLRRVQTKFKIFFIKIII